MKIDRRITNGLTWAGAVLVVGVPTADLLSAQFAAKAEPATAQVAVVAAPTAPAPAPLSQRPKAPVSEPVEQVAVAKPAEQVASTPAAKPVVAASPKPAQTANVVDTFIQSGKPLPSYITGAGDKPAAQPAKTAAAPAARTPIITTPPAGTAVPVAPVADPVEVAAIPPQKIAPVPMPLSMRPDPIRVPVAVAPPVQEVYVPAELGPRSSATVTADELEDWETGPLSEFLARKQGSAATMTRNGEGFFLDEAPQPRRGDRVIGWEEPVFSFFAD
ncbi:MAG TPA: hypothetical protein VIL88_00625 [Devosia sp.]|jgi:hypothetical protein|uniref:hypothetical protein n=1 Tax=Devosia sp. TaxID=1871048 RepID=UPI002F9324EB